jgi:N-acetylmuramoyl-L-alanine amidase
MKRLSVFLCVTLLLAVFVLPENQSRAALPIRVFLTDSGEIEFMTKPVNISDRVYVSASETFSLLGVTVFLRPDTGEAFFSKGGKGVLFTADSKQIIVNDTAKEIPAAPKMLGGVFMVPLRFAVEEFGFDVSMDNATGFIYITGFETANPIDLEAGAGPETALLARDASPADIKAASYPKTAVKDIILGELEYTVKASSEISRVEKFLLSDNRLVLDIYNAELDMETKSFDINGDFLKSIRAAQNQVRPEFITRVVFDLSQPVSYSVTLSSDRKNLNVSFRKNAITNVSVESKSSADYVKIEGLYAPAVSMFPLRDPERLVIDMPLTYINNISLPANGVMIRTVRGGQFAEERARVVIDLIEAGEYSVSVVDNTTVIRIAKPNYRNIEFSSDLMRLFIERDEGFTLKPSDIIHNDRYDIFKYIFTFPGDYSAYLGSGVMTVGDRYISTVEIETVNGQTQVTFNQNEILAYHISEDEDGVYIQAMLPRDKYSRIVVLDPGHGGSQPGSVWWGVLEKDVNLDTVLRLIRLLDDDPAIKVYSTRLTDVNPTLDDRVAFAEKLGADLFISIHYNGIENNSSVRGAETFYSLKQKPDPKYKLTSLRAAEIVQARLTADVGLRSRGVKTADYVVIRDAKMPAVLAEIAFLSNPEENKLIASAEFRQKAAEALYLAVWQIFAEYTPPR